MKKVKIIGGGLAGCEAAYQLLKRNISVELYEMRPNMATEAHNTSDLAELVCSNSLKSTDTATAQGALKEELRLLDSLILRSAEETSVPAGGALAVDRKAFSNKVEKALMNFDNFNLIRQEQTQVDDFTIVATGPLTSKNLSKQLETLLGQQHLYFYDAVAPIVSYQSIDQEKSFFGGRYGKGGDDYLNCPMDSSQYYAFVEQLITADRVLEKDFEKKDIFDACIPIEIMAQRGRDSLRFGPLRPVGLMDLSSTVKPYAVVQLRKEDNYNQLYNLVGFQTNLKFGEQERVFRMIPALRQAEFIRYGVMHRNTFINSPSLLNDDLSLKSNDTIFFAGQLCGVEGYMESCMSGLLAAINIYRKLHSLEVIMPNEYTISGSLIKYITTITKNFQPMHVSFSLLPPLSTNIKNKKERKLNYSKRAMENIKKYITLL